MRQMADFFQTLLPKKADNEFPGIILPLVVFTALTLVGIARSLIHLFAPDGGAGSIAGMDLSVEGASGIIFAFGLWGSSQLLLGLLQVLVILRYRSLVPMMYLLLILEFILRMLIGLIKPVNFQNTPPGAVGNWMILPLAAIMFGLCFIKPKLPSN